MVKPNDLEEANDLTSSNNSTEIAVRQTLDSFLKTCPPAPLGDPASKNNKANKSTKDRPVYPEWKRLIEQ